MVNKSDNPNPLHCVVVCIHCQEQMALTYVGKNDVVKVECLRCHRNFSVSVKQIKDSQNDN